MDVDPRSTPADATHSSTKPSKRAAKYPGNRFRLPNIDTPGIIQQSMLETALWPTDPSFQGPIYEPSYQFSRSKGAPRETAHVQIRSPFGLKQTDPYILWGLLGATIERGDNAELVATPYWMLNYLGLHRGGTQYNQLAEALERLAMTGYANRSFYDPTEQEYKRVAFSFFSTWLPTTDRKGTVDPERTWRIQWDAEFFRITKATNGSMLFDLEILRKLKPTTRQLFLMLHNRFWRESRVFMNIDGLTVNGMGMSASRPLKKRKAALIASIQELLDLGIIDLGRGQQTASDLIFRKGKGVFVASFYKGSYFKAPASDRTSRRTTAVKEDELYEPLKKIGLNDQVIRRAFKEISRARIQQAVRITEMAMHEKPEGFPGFKKNPAAFCWNFMTSEYMPPDWVYQHEKKERQAQWERDREQADEHERMLRSQYDKARKAALKKYLQGEGKKHWEEAYKHLVEFYRAEGSPRYQQLAGDAAVIRVEQQFFEFPEFSGWAMNQLENN